MKLTIDADSGHPEVINLGNTLQAIKVHGLTITLDPEKPDEVEIRGIGYPTQLYVEPQSGNTIKVGQRPIR